MKTGADILVVDDEPTVRKLFKRAFEQAGYSVRLAETGKAALENVDQKIPDLMILDFNLPDISGKDVCLHLRRNRNSRSVPIIIVTGNSSDSLPIECLDSGADDYVTKPFDMTELLARSRALLRRPPVYLEPDMVIRKGPLTILTAERLIYVNGKKVPRLTPKEFDLLHQIVLHAPRVMEKNMLALKVWGQTLDSLHSRTVDVHIRRIRAKLGPHASQFLVTIPSVGFQWFDSPFLLPPIETT